MAAGLPVNIAGFAQEVANIIGINNWNLQEASYNGAQFHWMQPSYNGLNPLAGLINYAESDFGGQPQKPSYGTWSNIISIKDAVKRKLCVFPVPNYNGYYIEDFGSAGVQVDIVGLVYGPDYQEVMQRCLAAFMDYESPVGSGSGYLTKTNFRQFVHPVFANVSNVYFSSYEPIASSDKWRAASFRMQLIVQQPDYLVTQSAQPTWQSEVQNILNQAQTIVISISQAVSLIQSVSPSSFGLTSGVTQPVLSGNGMYPQSIENQIQIKLNTITSIFQSSMAFFVHNSAGQIQNSYWDAIVVNFSLLPIYLTSSESFSYSDAQAIITAYVNKITEFIDFAEKNNYNLDLQNNISAMKTSVVYLNNVAELFLAQNENNITSTTNSQTDLYTLMFANNVGHASFDKINSLNRGVWFSCLRISSGTEVNLS